MPLVVYAVEVLDAANPAIATNLLIDPPIQTRSSQLVLTGNAPPLLQVAPPSVDLIDAVPLLPIATTVVLLAAAALHVALWLSVLVLTVGFTALNVTLGSIV